MATAKKKTTRKTAKPKARKLSDIPSAFIVQALNDLEAVERSKKYTVFMYTWHSPSLTEDDGPCAVCFAGAVMAKSLKCDSTVHSTPHQFSREIEKKLFALDDLRTGEVASFCNHLGLDYDAMPESIQQFAPVSYGEYPELFKAQILGFALQLEALGY